MNPPIAVVVGVLFRPDGTLLLCQRSAEKNYPLQWEFPGGKVEPGESAVDALVRELREELAIEAVVGSLLHEKTAHYANGGTFAVAYYRIESWSGEIRNQVFADLHWVYPGDLMDYDILAGNREFCERLAAGDPAGLSA
jgi:8-oxo-dGTP diphosphatase